MNDAGSGASDKIDSDDDDGKKVNVKKLPTTTTLLSPLFGSPPLIQQQQKNPVFEPFPKILAPSWWHLQKQERAGSSKLFWKTKSSILEI